MSKKTAPKKKPTQLDRIEALAKSAHAEAGLAHAATIALQQRIDAMRHEQVALSQESRSAPAEWTPKVGELAVFDCIIGRLDSHIVASDSWLIHGRWAERWQLSKPPEAEVSAHKAKEEQRVREEEREKELAKVPEFGTRVKWGSYTGRVACEGPDHENQYLVAYKPGNGSVWHSTWVRRRDLTIID